MPIFDHFNLIAPFYDRVIKTRDPGQLREMLSLPSAAKLLDAGGGTGRVSQAFIMEVSQVVVVDLSLGMLRQAVQKGGMAVVNSPTEVLPFEDDIFDAVMMVDALHHVINGLRTVQELWRVLKPGGRLVIEEPDIRTMIVKLVAIAEKIALMRSHFISPQHISNMIQDKEAQIHIVRDGYTSWIVASKYLPDGNRESTESSNGDLQ